MNSVQLTPAEKQLLLEMADSGPEMIRHRARLILAYAEGKPTLQAAQFANISRGRGRFWKREFLRERMAIFGGEKNLEDESNQLTSYVTIPPAVEAVDEQTEIIEPAVEEKLSKKERKRAGKKGKWIEVPVLPFPEVVNKPGVLADDTLAEAGRKVFRAQFAEMLSHEEATRLGEDIDALHDMRVATRRMRAAMAVFGDSFDKKIIKWQLNGLRQIGRALGRVRDLDVFMEKAREYLFSLSFEEQVGLNPLLTDWESQLFEARNQLLAHLESQDYLDFKQVFNYFVQTEGLGAKEIPENPPTPHRVREVVPCLIYTRLGAVRAYGSHISTATIPQLHALRIEFKQLRYTLEYFSEVLGNEAKQVIELIKKLQDHLGNLHDADVACQILSTFLRNWDDSQLGLLLTLRENPEPIVNYLAFQHAERHRLMISFTTEWERFETPETMRKISLAISVL